MGRLGDVKAASRPGKRQGKISACVIRLGMGEPPLARRLSARQRPRRGRDGGCTAGSGCGEAGLRGQRRRPCRALPPRREVALSRTARACLRRLLLSPAYFSSAPRPPWVMARSGCAPHRRAESRRRRAVACPRLCIRFRRSPTAPASSYFFQTVALSEESQASLRSAQAFSVSRRRKPRLPD